MSSSAFIVPFDHQTNGQVAPGLDPAELWATTPSGEKAQKVGTTRVFYNTPPSKVTAVSSLGDKFSAKKGNAKRELVRKSVGSAVKDLKAIDGVKDVTVDASTDPHAAGTAIMLLHVKKSSCLFSPAVAAHLALYKFTLKTSPPSAFDPRQKEPTPDKLNFTPLQSSKEWDQGVIYAKAQNFARTVCRNDLNYIFPSITPTRVS